MLSLIDYTDNWLYRYEEIDYVNNILTFFIITDLKMKLKTMKEARL